VGLLRDRHDCLSPLSLSLSFKRKWHLSAEGRPLTYRFLIESSFAVFSYVLALLWPFETNFFPLSDFSSPERMNQAVPVQIIPRLPTFQKGLP